MSGAVPAVQTALMAALQAHAPFAGAISGIFDGPPRRASFPYAAIGDAVSADWGSKGARGREIRIAVMLHDDGERPGRLHGLMAAAEDAIEAMARDLEGWRVASLVFLRARVARDVDGPWLGTVEYRVRVMAA